MTVLHDNKNYSVVVTDIRYDGQKQKGYAVINKTTEVTECETSALPYALQVAEEFDSKLQGGFHKLFSYRKEDAAVQGVLGFEVDGSE